MGLTMDELVDDLNKVRFYVMHGERNGHYGYMRPEKEEAPTTSVEEFDVELVSICGKCVSSPVFDNNWINRGWPAVIDTYIPWEPVIVNGVELRVAIDDKGIVYIADKATVMDKKMFPKRVIV